jgi:hypothetical protein
MAMFHVVVTRSGPELDRAQPLDGQSLALRGDVPADDEQALARRRSRFRKSREATLGPGPFPCMESGAPPDGLEVSGE